LTAGYFSGQFMARLFEFSFRNGAVGADLVPGR
jgi:hypothetical protein